MRSGSRGGNLCPWCFGKPFNARDLLQAIGQLVQQRSTLILLPGGKPNVREHKPTQILARRTADTGYRKEGRSLERIKGQMIFVAEDEPLVSLDIADALLAAGANVVSAHNVRDALTIAATADLSAAVLDVNLAGEGCSLICQELVARGIPFLFHTGYTDVPFLDKWPLRPC